MAVTVQNCVDAWAAGVDAAAKRDAVVAKLTQLLPEERMVAVTAAIDGLSAGEQLQACAAMLSVIAVKAGAQAGEYANSAAVAGEAVAGEAVAGDADFTVDSTPRFRAATTALTDNQLLQAAALPIIMRAVPDEEEEDEDADAAAPVREAPIVTFRRQFAAARHPADPAAQLAVLVGDTSPDKLRRAPQAPATMDAETAQAYYAHLVREAADPEALIDGGDVDSPLVALAKDMQGWHAKARRIDAALTADAATAQAAQEGEVSRLFPGLLPATPAGVDYGPLYLAVLTAQQAVAKAAQKGAPFTNPHLARGGIGHLHAFLAARGFDATVQAARAEAVAAVMREGVAARAAASVPPAGATFWANQMGQGLGADAPAGTDGVTDQLSMAADLHLHAARTLAAKDHGADAAARTQQLTDVQHELHEAFGRLGYGGAWATIQEDIFQHMPEAERLAAYRAIAAGPLDDAEELLEAQAGAGALVVAAQEGVVAPAAAVKATALRTALDGDPNDGDTAPLFTDVPAAEHWRVMQAMVRVAQAHAAKIRADQMPLQWLKAQMGVGGSADVQRELHLAVAAALPAQVDCARAQSLRIIAADPSDRAGVCVTLLGLLQRFDQPAVLAALGRIATGDVTGLPQRANVEACHAAAQLVALAPMAAPASQADNADGAVIYRAAALALGLERNAPLPASMAAYMLPRAGGAADPFAPQRAQAVLQEVAYLVKGGMALADARTQVDTALAAGPAAGRLAVHDETLRRIQLREAAAIAALRPVKGRQQAVRTAFAAAVGVAPVAFETRQNGLRLAGAPAAAGSSSRVRAAQRSKDIQARTASVLGDAAQAMLDRGGDVPQFADVAALRRDPAMVAAQRLKSEADLQAARDAIGNVTEDALTRTDAAQAILRAFGHAGDEATANAFLGHMKGAMRDAMGGEPDAKAWQAALTAVLDEVNHRAVSPAAAQSMLTVSHPVWAEALRSRRDDVIAYWGRVHGAQPVQRGYDLPGVQAAASDLAMFVALHQQAKAAMEAAPWVVAEADPAVMATQLLVAGDRPLLNAQLDSINRARLLAAAGEAAGAAADSLPAQLRALQDAVVAAKIPLSTHAVNLTDTQLGQLYQEISAHLMGSDAAVRAMINAFTLAHRDLTVGDMLLAAVRPSPRLAAQLLPPQTADARARRARALAAVVRVEHGDSLSLRDMAAVESTVRGLALLSDDVAAALYTGFKTDPTVTLTASQVVTDPLSHSPGSNAMGTNVAAGADVRAAAMLGRNDSAADSSRIYALAIDAMLQEAARAATPQGALRAMFKALYQHAAQHADVNMPRTGAAAEDFAERCLAYLHGDARAATWTGVEFTGPFEAMRREMLGMPTEARSVLGAIWDPADMRGRAALSDEARLAHMRASLSVAAERLEAAQGAEGMHQLRLRDALRVPLVALEQGGKGALEKGRAALDRVLRGLHKWGVVRTEDIQAMLGQYDKLTDVNAAKAFVNSIVTHGWDFTYGKPVSDAIGFVPAGNPMVVTSLGAKAREAERAIAASVNSGVRVRVVQAPTLVKAPAGGTTVKAGELVEGSGDAVIQVGAGRPGTSEGQVTLRRTGAVITQDPKMTLQMVKALVAANPQGGAFTPTDALMGHKGLLVRALTALADATNGTGAKWEITLTAQAQQSLPSALVSKLSAAGVDLKAPAPQAGPQFPGMPRAGRPSTSRVMHDAARAAGAGKGGSAHRSYGGPAKT